MSRRNDNVPEGYRITQLGPLPETWAVASLHEATARARARVGRVMRHDYRMAGRYPVIDQGQSFIAAWTDEEEKVYNGPLPLIIFGDHTRAFKFVDFPFVIGADGVKLVHPKTERVDARFLYYALLSTPIESRGYNRHYHQLVEKKVPLPPLPEQKKIAAVLSAVQQAKEKTEAVIAAAKELKKSLMKHLFTYGPVPIDQAENVPLKETEIGEMPEQWDVSRLGEKGSFQYGYTASATEENTGIKFLRITDIGNGGRVTWGDVPYVSLDRGSLQKFRLCPGELLFARIGATTGKTYLADRTTPEAVFASYLIRFNADDSIHPPYALYYTRTTRYWELVSAGKGGKLKKGLSATQLKSFALPVPPIAEQREIAAILSAVDHDTEIQDDKRKALEGLFRTLLNNLMAGKVRVVEQ